MHVDASSGDDLAFAGDHFRSWSNDYRDVWLYVWIACLTDRCDASVLDGDISFDNSPVIQNERISDYCVQSRKIDRKTTSLTNWVVKRNEFSAI